MFSRTKKAHYTGDELPPDKTDGRPPPEYTPEGWPMNQPANDEAPAPRPLHPELEAMDRVYAALSPLNGPGRGRVLEWILEVMDTDPPHRPAARSRAEQQSWGEEPS